MAFFLAEQEEKVEYVYPFVCGLCGYGSGNIDLFHHHFETHAEHVPSSVFHLCEIEYPRDGETGSELNIGSFCCKTCNHTFPTVCNLLKHLDDDSNTDKYIMDLQTKTAYPITSQSASVLSHTFIGAQNKNGERVSATNYSRSGKWSSSNSTQKTSPKGKQGAVKARSRSGKTGPRQTVSDQRNHPYSFAKLLSEAQNKQKAAYDIYNSVEDLDYSDVDEDDDGFDDNSSEVRVMQDKLNEDNDEGSGSKLKKGDNWINCKYCGLSFRKQRKKGLKEHEEEHLTYEGNLKHTAESLCRCEQCGCVMKRVNSHLHVCPSNRTIRKRRPRAKRGEPKKSLDRRMVPCPHCDKTLKKYILSTHIIKVHMEHNPVPCQICGKMMRSKYALTSHVNTVHKAEKKFKCQKCDMRFYSRYKRKVHMVKHTDVRNYQCDVCPKSYKDNSSLKAHKDRVHTDENERVLYQCELCPKSYGYRDGLSQHQRHVHNIRVKPVDPDKIKKPKESEKTEEDYTCEKCGKTFLLKCSLNSHMRSHGEYFAKLPYLCDECPEKYHTKQGLKRHKQRKHCEGSEPTIYMCDICPKMFLKLYSLKKHQKEFHAPGDNWFICGWKSCRHKFRSDAELEAHRNVHKDGREFPCTTCEKTFMTMPGLQQHNRRVHQQKFGQKGDNDVSSQTGSQNAGIEASSFDSCTQTPIETADAGTYFDTGTHNILDAADVSPSVDEITESLIQATQTGPISSVQTQNVEDTVNICPMSSGTQTIEGSVMEDIAMETKTSETVPHWSGPSLNDSEELLIATKLISVDQENYPNTENEPASTQCRCKVCKLQFDSNRTLISHMKDEHRFFKCDKCPRYYAIKDSLRRHKVKDHTAQSRKEFRCDKCPRVYKWMDSLRTHIKKSHNPADTWFPCTFGTCRKKFKTQEQLDDHSKLHEAYQCKICLKRFVKNDGLRQHTSEAHPETLPQAIPYKNADKTLKKPVEVYIVDTNKQARLVSDHNYDKSASGDIDAHINEEEDCKLKNKDDRSHQKGDIHNKKETVKFQNQNIKRSSGTLTSGQSVRLRVFSGKDAKTLENTRAKKFIVKHVKRSNSPENADINTVESTQRNDQQKGNINPGIEKSRAKKFIVKHVKRTKSPENADINTAESSQRNDQQKGNINPGFEKSRAKKFIVKHVKRTKSPENADINTAESSQRNDQQKGNIEPGIEMSKAKELIGKDVKSKDSVESETVSIVKSSQKGNDKSSIKHSRAKKFVVKFVKKTGTDESANASESSQRKDQQKGNTKPDMVSQKSSEEPSIKSVPKRKLMIIKKVSDCTSSSKEVDTKTTGVSQSLKSHSA